MIYEIGAGLSLAAMFYLAGAVVLPPAWTKSLAGAAPVFLGTAAYVLISWIAVTARSVPLLYVISGFAAATAVLACARPKIIKAAVQGALTRRSLARAAMFVFFYILAYLYVTPAAGAHLQLPVYGSFDTITHATHARNLLEHGSSRFAGAPFDYTRHPAVSFLLAALSLFFHRNPLNAVMPLQLAAGAAAAVFIVEIARSTFGLSPKASFMIAAVAVSGSFSRFAASALLLPATLGMLPLLYLVWTTARTSPKGLRDSEMIIAFCGSYTLLWFIDPLMLMTGMVTHLIVIASRPATSADSRQTAVRLLAVTAVTLLALAASFHQMLRPMIGSLISSVRNSSASEHLGLISPLALFGWPDLVQTQGHGPARQYLDALSCGALAIVLLAVYERSFGSNASAPQRTLVRTAAIVYVAYVALFIILGSSAPHWRIASMSVLPLAFVPLAAMAHAIGLAPATFRWLAVDDARLSRAMVAYVAVALILGNIAVHAVSRPPRQATSIAWQQLEAVRNRDFTTVALQLRDSSPETQALARYYFAGSTLTFIEPGLSAERLPYDAISERQPMFIQNVSCAAVGHDQAITVRGLGCLLLAPPGPRLNVAYPFNRRFLFIAHDAMTARDPGGRWNIGPVLEWRVTADPEKVPLDREIYLNVSLNPFLAAGVVPPRLVFTWKDGDTAQFSVDRDTQISLVVLNGDWTGNRLWTLPVRIDVPDGRTILFRDLSLSESPRGRPVMRRTAASR